MQGTIVRPSYLKHAEILIEEEPNLPVTVKKVNILVNEVLFQDSNSVYVLYKNFNSLINYLHEKGIDLVDDFNSKLNEWLNKFGVNAYNAITQDIITQYYNSMLTKTGQKYTNNNSQGEEGEEGEGDEGEDEDEKYTALGYNELCTLITERGLVVWCLSEKFNMMLMDPSIVLSNIDIKFTNYYQRKKFAYTINLVLDKWEYESNIVDFNYFMNIHQSSIENAIIAQNKPTIVSSDDNDSDGNNLISEDYYSTNISNDEIITFSSLQCLQIYSMFLIGDYNKAIKIYQDSNDSMKLGLSGLDNSMIDGSSIVDIIILCVVLTKNNSDIENFLKNNLCMETHLSQNNEIKQFLSCIDNLDFSKMKQLFNKIFFENIKWCSMLEKSCKKAYDLLIREMIIFFLSISEKISIQQLSETFFIDYDEIKKIVIDSIVLLDLPMSIDNDILSYTPKPDSSISSIHEYVDTECIRVRSLLLNKSLEFNCRSNS